MASVNLIPILLWATFLVAAIILSPWFLIPAFGIILAGAWVDLSP